MAVRSRFTRPPTHTHSSAVSFTPFVCLFYMSTNTYTQCTRRAVHYPNRTIIILAFILHDGKKTIQGEKKKESGKAVSKMLPHVRFLTNVPMDICPVCLCVWLLWLGSVSLDPIWFLIRWCIKCLAPPSTSLSAAGPDQHHLGAWMKTSISCCVATVGRPLLVFHVGVSSSRSSIQT